MSESHKQLTSTAHTLQEMGQPAEENHNPHFVPTGNKFIESKEEDNELNCSQANALLGLAAMDGDIETQQAFNKTQKQP